MLLRRLLPGRGLMYLRVGIGSWNLVQDWTWEQTRFPLPISLFCIHLFWGTGTSGKPVNRKARCEHSPWPGMCQGSQPQAPYMPDIVLSLCIWDRLFKS